MSVPKSGKLTLEIKVNPKSKLWHWIYETMKDNKARNGIEVFSLCNGWLSEERDLYKAIADDFVHTEDLGEP